MFPTTASCVRYPLFLEVMHARETCKTTIKITSILNSFIFCIAFDDTNNDFANHNVDMYIFMICRFTGSDFFHF